MDTNEAKERRPKQSVLTLNTLQGITNRATEIELEALIRSDGASTDAEAAPIAQIKLLARIAALQEELIDRMDRLIILIGSDGRVKMYNKKETD